MELKQKNLYVNIQNTQRIGYKIHLRTNTIRCVYIQSQIYVHLCVSALNILTVVVVSIKFVLLKFYTMENHKQIKMKRKRIHNTSIHIYA